MDANRTKAKYCQDAMLTYRQAWQDLISNGFACCVTTAPKSGQYYHFIDATGKQLSGYLAGVLPNGIYAVSDINNAGCLADIHPVLYKPMTASEVV